MSPMSLIFPGSGSIFEFPCKKQFLSQINISDITVFFSDLEWDNNLFLQEH